ncbi:ATP-binding protein [Streptomyces sp. NPDC102451]|uniref:ATP-binding protein n=1 Tax=Streptomyces sp. NPDC102451 TaxID=3366177 RepID=UPI00380F4BA0
MRLAVADARAQFRLGEARRLAQQFHLTAEAVNDTVSLVVGELAANAVTHGLVPGRETLLRLVRVTGERVRVEVADTRGECWPVVRGGTSADGEAGRGLVLVDALVEAWGVVPREGAPGKTVWAEVAVPAVT